MKTPVNSKTCKICKPGNFQHVRCAKAYQTVQRKAEPKA